MQTVFQLCLTVIPMMFSLSMFGVITDSMLTNSVPSSDSGKALLLCSQRENHQKTQNMSMFNQLVLVLVHRHDVGTLFFRSVAAADSWTDYWGLPVCKLRRFLHRDRSVCDERHRFRVPAAASSQKDRRAKGMRSLEPSPSSVGDGGRENRCSAAGTAQA